MVEFTFKSQRPQKPGLHWMHRTEVEWVTSLHPTHYLQGTLRKVPFKQTVVFYMHDTNETTWIMAICKVQHSDIEHVRGSMTGLWSSDALPAAPSIQRFSALTQGHNAPLPHLSAPSGRVQWPR
jgi:hypothetical protein